VLLTDVCVLVHKGTSLSWSTITCSKSMKLMIMLKLEKENEFVISCCSGL